ncbi:MAG: hypothetical protein POG24_08135, partial [Acidocella sp.]|nr:hypothetical protein [Acidocella sp.]
MSRNFFLTGASAFALIATAGLAQAAAPVAGHIASMRVSPAFEIDLSALAKSPANQAALAQRGPLMLPPLRFPTADGRARPAQFGPRLAPTIHHIAPVSTLTGFNGSYDGELPAVLNYELEPPDQGLAVYNNTVVEDVNNVLQIYSASGKQLTGAVSDYALFKLTETDAPVLSDPHVEFDPAVGRWFIEEVIELSNGFNGFALAVSETSNPAGKYYVYQIDDEGANISACGGSCLADYPQPGFDANAYYIDADLFSNTSGNFVDTGLYALPMTALVTGQSFTYDYYLLPEFVLQPAIPAIPGGFASEGNGTEFFMSAQNILDGTDTLSIWSISNTGMIGSSTPPNAYNTILTAEAYTSTVPSTEPNDVGSYGMSQGATQSPQLDGGYNSLSGGVKFFDNALYSAL